MEYCVEGHPPAVGQDICLWGHRVVRARTGDAPITAEAEPMDNPGEASCAKPVWKDRAYDEATTKNEGDSMGDNISTPTIQGFGGFGPWGHWKDRDGLEGKDAVLIHALQDGRDHKDTLRGVLDSKFDVVSILDGKIDRVRDRLDDKFDKLECKVERKFERAEDKAEDFERRLRDRLTKEQDDKIQELKLELLLCKKSVIPTPPVPPVPAP